MEDSDKYPDHGRLEDIETMPDSPYKEQLLDMQELLQTILSGVAEGKKLEEIFDEEEGEEPDERA